MAKPTPELRVVIDTDTADGKFVDAIYFANQSAYDAISEGDLNALIAARVSGWAEATAPKEPPTSVEMAAFAEEDAARIRKDFEAFHAKITSEPLDKESRLDSLRELTTAISDVLIASNGE